MKKESLEELREKIIEYIDVSERMDTIDKGELMLNMTKIIDNYDEVIKVLAKERKDRWRKGIR